MYSRILFPTDFGEHADQVLRCVLTFKHVGLKEIIFLHVVNVGELGWYSSPEYLKLRQEQLQEVASIKCHELEARARSHGLDVSSIVTTGIPSIEIVSAAREKNVSLIVGGSHRKRKQQEDLLDTTTARVVRSSPIPVFVARYHSDWEDAARCEEFCGRQFSKLLVPVDWSDCAMKAVDYVACLKDQGVQEIVVAHVMDEHALQYSEAKQIEEVRQDDLERLEHTKARLGLAGFQVRTHLHFGTPHKEVLRIAREENITLIVMGHHGKGWFKNLVIGSTTERVLREAHTSVLVVNDQD